MKKLKLFTDIEESYNELVYKVSWPTKSQLINSSIIVMVASIIIALVILLMDLGIDTIMHFIYSLNN
ncbi:MAG: preprotein translocase subunit SecE [Bacteroidales bacterium]